MTGQSSVSQPPATETTPLLSSHSALQRYSVFTNGKKRLVILAAALASSFSPFSANIYYPSLNSIAADLHVTSSQINLTITTYMICQGLAPSFMGSFADQAGRRPAYILCFVIYIIGNIALALQHNYIALLVLRAVQSCGSSGTVALASAVAADVITSAERGMYMGITSLGNILAPSLGPILGGFLSQYLGWQAIFWFLALAAITFFIPLFLFFPETCRAIVGDGSIPATGWNQSVWNRWHKGHATATSSCDVEGSPGTCRDAHLAPQKRSIIFPNPLSTLRLLFELPTGPLVLANGIVFASYYSVTAGIPSQFKTIYGLSDLGIGLSFIPAGLGSLVSATFNGLIVDWNYIRLRRKSGEPVSKDQKQDHGAFPIEKARLQIGLPMTVAAALSVAWHGTLIESKPALSIALALVFLISFCITAAYNVMNVLLVDLYYTTPATAMAANNLVRCFLGAAATAVIHPMIQKWGNLTTYWAVAGAILSWKRTDALQIPCISTLNLNTARTYLLLFVDIDVVLESCSTTVLHWYQPHMTASATSHCNDNGNGWLVNRTSNGAEYIAPQSPPYTRHRYVYLLYEQDPDYVFPECFGHIFPKTREGRGGFDIKQFVEIAGLRAPVAGNFFYVDNDAATTTAALGGLVPTTTWFRSAPCRSEEPKSTGFSPMEANHEVDQQQVVI
ncbi:quinidine resistance protein 1 [Aspergillus udagawae]|uniref:Quinidine resistance protein 1 n=1 Tax=Aspergillus udagawae TaxID=91492 RepID=A0A8H3NZ25_9EURO|nr:quinidine resistance protein 1 [Aspergillus udagawae]